MFPISLILIHGKYAQDRHFRVLAQASAFAERRISSQIWPLAPPVDVMRDIIEVQCEMNVKDEPISVKDSVKI